MTTTEPVEYRGFREYIDERTASLTSQDQKRILTCLLLDESLPLFLQLLNDGKGKMDDVQAYVLENAYGRIGLASASRGPIIIARGLPVGEAVRLYRISRCFRNFRAPMTMAFIVLDWKAATAYLTARHAGNLIEYYEARLKPPGIMARIKRLRGDRARNPEEWIDPLDHALTRCLEKHSSKNYPVIRDAMRYIDSGLEQMVLADEEEKNSILLFPGKTCPIQSLAIFDASIGYAIYAADVG